MYERQICPLLSLKKGEKELHPCLEERCGWFCLGSMKCGIKAIADDMPYSLDITINEMPPVQIQK